MKNMHHVPFHISRFTFYWFGFESMYFNIVCGFANSKPAEQSACLNLLVNTTAIKNDAKPAPFHCVNKSIKFKNI
jgi:hypothetical protein